MQFDPDSDEDTKEKSRTPIEKLGRSLGFLQTPEEKRIRKRESEVASGMTAVICLVFAGGIFIACAIGGHPIGGFLLALITAPVYGALASISSDSAAKEQVRAEVAVERKAAKAATYAHTAALAANEAAAARRQAEGAATSIPASAIAAQDHAKRAANAAISGDKLAEKASELAAVARQAATAAAEAQKLKNLKLRDEQVTLRSREAAAAAKAATAAAADAQREQAAAAQAAKAATRAIADESETRKDILQHLVAANDIVNAFDRSDPVSIRQGVSMELEEVLSRLDEPSVVSLLERDHGVHNLLKALQAALNDLNLSVPHAQTIIDAARLNPTRT